MFVWKEKKSFFLFYFIKCIVDTSISLWSPMRLIRISYKIYMGLLKLNKFCLHLQINNVVVEIEKLTYLWFPLVKWRLYKFICIWIWVSWIFLKSIEVQEACEDVKLNQRLIELNKLAFYSCFMFVVPLTEVVISAYHTCLGNKKGR